jgi:hypothetical protein
LKFRGNCDLESSPEQHSSIVIRPMLPSCDLL